MELSCRVQSGHSICSSTDAVTLSEVSVVPADGGQASEGHAGGTLKKPTHTQSSDVGDQPRQDDASVLPASCLNPIAPSSLVMTWPQLTGHVIAENAAVGTSCVCACVCWD